MLCDMVVMYLLKKGAFYKEKKYQIITDDDAFTGLESGTHPGYGSTQHTDGVSVRVSNQLVRLVHVQRLRLQHR